MTENVCLIPMIRLMSIIALLIAMIRVMSIITLLIAMILCIYLNLNLCQHLVVPISFSTSVS